MQRLLTVLVLSTLAFAASPALAEDEHLQAPQLIQRVAPSYPEQLRAEGIGGDVLLELELDETGKPFQVHLLDGVHPELDNAALVAARKLRFQPALLDGEPVPSRVHYRFHFTATASQQQGDASALPSADEVELLGETVQVVAERPWRVFTQVREQPVDGAVVGTYRVGRRDLELTPGAVSDVNMVIHTLPSVSRSSFFVSNYSIRGGTNEETVTYLDGIRLYRTDAQGMLSSFNPNLVDTITVHAGSQPTQLGGSVAGVTDIRYADPENDRIHALVDLSLLNLSGQISGPLGPSGSPASFVLSARRSLLDLYLAFLQAAGRYEGVKLGYGDVFFRLHVDPGQRGDNKLDVTLLWADDQQVLAPSDTLVNVTQNIQLLGAVRHDWRFAGRARWSQQVAVTWERSRAERGEVELRQSQRLLPSGRLDWNLPLFKTAQLAFGADFHGEYIQERGEFFDLRRRPTWVDAAWADDHALLTHLDTDRWRPELALYADLTWTKLLGLPLEGRLGLRATPWNITGVPVASPRGSLAVHFASGTSVKVHGGIQHQFPTQRGVYDPEIGNADPRPQRAWTLAAAVDQRFDVGLHLGVEAWTRKLENLLVWPDTPEALARGVTYSSTGTGFARGVDVSAGFRRPSWGASASYSYLHTRRTNPLNEAGPNTYEPGSSTPHMLKVSGDIKLGRRRDWTLSASFSLAQGRPYTPVVHSFDRSTGTWLGRGYEYNQHRHGWMNTFSIRMEHRRVYWGRLKLSLYVDLANIRLDPNSTVMRVRDKDYDDPSVRPSLPELFDAAGVPLLPWVGIRGEL